MDTQITTSSQNNTRKIFAIIQIIFSIIVAFLPYLESMFRWTSWNFDGSYTKTTPMSLENLMLTQEIGAGPIPFYLFYVALVAMILYCILQIFRETLATKFSVILPILMLAFSAIMIFSANAHNDTYTYYGELRYCAARMQFPAYLHLLCIVIIVALEAYKQFKIKD